MRVTLFKIAAVCASLLAAVGGLWILCAAKWGDKNDALSIGIGFYFLAKAFFLGPTLYLIASQQAEGKPTNSG